MNIDYYVRFFNCDLKIPLVGEDRLSYNNMIIYNGSTPKTAKGVYNHDVQRYTISPDPSISKFIQYTTYFYTDPEDPDYRFYNFNRPLEYTYGESVYKNWYYHGYSNPETDLNSFIQEICDKVNRSLSITSYSVDNRWYYHWLTAGFNTFNLYLFKLVQDESSGNGMCWIPLIGIGKDSNKDFIFNSTAE